MADSSKKPVSAKAPAAKPAAPVAAPAAKKTVPAAVAAPVVAKPAPAKPAPVATKPAVTAKPAPVAPKAAPAPIKTSTPPAPAPAPQITEKGPIMNETVTKTTEAAKNFAQDAQAKTTEMFGDLNGRAKSAMERSGKFVEEMNEFNKGNIEAMVESSKVAAKAAEQLAQQAAESARKNFESATAAMKSFASVKTPTEFFQLQSEYARSAFDSMMSETSKNSEQMLKLASDVFQPISNRLSVAAEKMKIAA